MWFKNKEPKFKITRSFNDYVKGELIIGVVEGWYSSKEEWQKLNINFLVKKKSRTILHNHPYIDVVTTFFDSGSFEPSKEYRLYFTSDDSKEFWL